MFALSQGSDKTGEKREAGGEGQGREIEKLMLPVNAGVRQSDLASLLASLFESLYYILASLAFQAEIKLCLLYASQRNS